MELRPAVAGARRTCRRACERRATSCGRRCWRAGRRPATALSIRETSSRCSPSAAAASPASTACSSRRKCVLTALVRRRFSTRSRSERTIRFFCEAMLAIGRRRIVGATPGGAWARADGVRRVRGRGRQPGRGGDDRRDRSRPRRGQARGRRGAGAQRPPSGRLARSTAFFSLATGLSRIAGLVREVFAASYFGVSPRCRRSRSPSRSRTGPQPVRGRRDPGRLRTGVHRGAGEGQQARGVPARLDADLPRRPSSSALITALFILIAPVSCRSSRRGSRAQTLDLTVALSRLLFPILVLLGVSGMVVGILNSYDRFGVFAIAPFFWNVAIIVVLVGLAPVFPQDRPDLRLRDRRPRGHRDPARDARPSTCATRRSGFAGRWWTRSAPGCEAAFGDTDVRRVLVLMLPVTISASG